jgi:dTMP kinase
VLCDRFIDSTRVYQGIAGAVGEVVVDRLHDAVLGDLRPDLTVVLDVPVAMGLRRRAASGQHRYEQMTSAFHEQVREGFLAVARAAPERCAVIDASSPADAVAGEIRALVARRFGVDLGPPAERR